MIIRPESARFAAAERIVRRLQEAGHQALLAGGCVRDLLLRHEPNDYDVATSARPVEVAEMFPGCKPVGAQFGVILVVVDHMSYDVATFRTEDGYSDGRRPDRVQFCGIEEDARRRDFTINAIYWDPIGGSLVDPTGGREDLSIGLVRAIGDAESRMREDHLRMLRAVRFAARFGFQVDPETERAIRLLAPLLSRVSAERICEELRMILTDRDPAAALRKMDELGLLAVLFPELEDAKGCEQPENFHPEGNVFVHSLLTVEKLGPSPEFVLALAALLHDVGKPPASRIAGPKRFPEHERIGREMTGQICRRLRLSRAETGLVCWLVHRHMYFHNARDMKDSTLKRLFAEPGFDQLCALVRADALASWGHLDHVDYVLERRQRMQPEEIVPPRLVTGHDLIERGYQPGPAFGRVLKEVWEMQLEGKLSRREEALAAAEEAARRLDVPRS